MDARGKSISSRKREAKIKFRKREQPGFWISSSSCLRDCCCCCEVTSVMSDSVRPHKRQPTRLPCPWDFPGKNTGVGCHFLLQCMKVKSESEVTQSCLTLCDPMDCSLPGSSIHGIFQGRLLYMNYTRCFSICFPSLHQLEFCYLQSKKP